MRDLVLYPDPRLRAICEPADPGSADATSAIEKLSAILDGQQGVGIAAPQVGVLQRIIVVDASLARRPVDNHGRLVLLNPAIALAEGKISFREGCMSIPDLVAHVSRAAKVTVSALLPDGQPTTISAEGFEAVILQHEIDHLEGILFIDRVKRARDIKPRG